MNNIQAKNISWYAGLVEFGKSLSVNLWLNNCHRFTEMKFQYTMSAKLFLLIYPSNNKGYLDFKEPNIPNIVILIFNDIILSQNMYQNVIFL